MKTIFGLISGLLFSTSGFAAGTERAFISYSNMYSFYSCDYAQTRTESYLQVLGAKDIRVRCMGGLPYDSFVSIDATFTPAADDGVWTPMTLEAKESCDFNETVVRELLKHFNIQNLHTSSSCWDSQGQFRYSFEM